jgi:putative Mn2+ efflux pump MntP
MSLTEMIIIAMGLAMDAFAVSLGVGAEGFTKRFRSRFRLSFHFGLFQFFMPIIGWILGTQIEKIIESYDHWIAFALLSFVGVRMIKEGVDKNTQRNPVDPTKSYTLIMLSLATSIDALAIGLSLGMLKVEIWYPCVVIGIVTAFLSFFGTVIGNKLQKRFGKMVEIIGGSIIIFIGLKILYEHLFIVS